MALKRLLELESGWRGRLDGVPDDAVGLVLLSSMVDQMVLSVLLWLLALRTMSLEEEICKVFGSNGFLLSEGTLDVSFLSSRSLFSYP